MDNLVVRRSKAAQRIPTQASQEVNCLRLGALLMLEPEGVEVAGVADS